MSKKIKFVKVYTYIDEACRIRAGMNGGSVLKQGAIILTNGMKGTEISGLKSVIIHFCSMDVGYFVMLLDDNNREIEKELRYFGIVFYYISSSGSREECWREGIKYLESVCEQIYAYAATEESISCLKSLKRIYAGNREIIEYCEEKEGEVQEQELWMQVRVRLMRHGRFFGPGVADLMRQIQFTNSVKTACERLGMSYSKGMQIIRRAEQEMHTDLVMRRQGGIAGGMAELTEEGIRLLETYERYAEAVKKYAEEIFHDYFSYW